MRRKVDNLVDVVLFLNKGYKKAGCVSTSRQRNPSIE